MYFLCCGSLLLLLLCSLLQTGCSDIVSRVVEDLKDEAEPYRWVCAASAAAVLVLSLGSFV